MQKQPEQQKRVASKPLELAAKSRIAFRNFCYDVQIKRDIPLIAPVGDAGPWVEKSFAKLEEMLTRNEQKQ